MCDNSKVGQCNKYQNRELKKRTLERELLEFSKEIHREVINRAENNESQKETKISLMFENYTVQRNNMTE